MDTGLLTRTFLDYTRKAARVNTNVTIFFTQASPCLSPGIKYGWPEDTQKGGLTADEQPDKCLTYLTII